MRLRFSFALAFHLIIVHTICYAQEVTVIDRSLKGQRLNELGLWNLGSDKIYEIFVTSVAGRAACYRADNLEPLWEKQITDDALTAPVIGNFMKTGVPVLAFGSASGEVFFLWPGTGEIISSFQSGLAFSLAPSVAEMEHYDLLVLADDQGKIAVLSLDPDTGLPTQRCVVSNTLPGSTAFSVIGQISHAPSCTDLNGDNAPEIVVTSDSGVVQVVSLNRDDPPTAPPKRYQTRLPQQSRATTLAGLGDISGTGEGFIVLGVNASLHLFSWDQSRPAESAIQPALQTPAFGSTLGHLLIGEINTDPVADLVSTAEGIVAARYMGSDFSGGRALLDIAPGHLTTTKPPFSPAVGMEQKDGTKILVAIDRQGIAWKWQPTSPANTMTQITGLPVPTAFTPAGDLTGNGKLSMVIWDEDSFTLSVATLPIDLAPVAAPALTLGVNYSRNGQWGADWVKSWQSKLTGQTEFLNQIKSNGLKATPEDTESTMDPVSIIAGIAPGDQIAREFRDARKGGSVWKLTGAAAGFIILAGIGLMVWKRRKA